MHVLDQFCAEIQPHRKQNLIMRKWKIIAVTLTEVELAYLSLLTEHFCCIFGFVPNIKKPGD